MDGIKHDLILGLPWIREHAPIIHWNEMSLEFKSGAKWILDTEEKFKIPQQVNVVRDSKSSTHTGFDTNDDDEPLLVTVKALLDKGRQHIVAEEVKPLLDDYDDVFAPLEEIPPEDRIKHEIHLIPDAKPVMKRPYRLAQPQAEEVHKQVEKALSEGWIQPSYSPWGTAIFVVGKKNGEWRMCVDYRELNALTEQDAYPLPRIDDILYKVAKARYFTTLDLQAGYYQIWIKKEDVPKTAFRLNTPVLGSSYYK